jgi:hypothetical protein
MGRTVPEVPQPRAQIEMNNGTNYNVLHDSTTVKRRLNARGQFARFTGVGKGESVIINKNNVIGVVATT